MPDDLTVIYFTSNHEDELFEQRIRETIQSSAQDTPIISVSQRPIAFGHNICVGDIGASPLNLLRQVMTGAIMARTKYLALTEADSLYPPSYFTFIPPRDDTIYYPSNSYVAWTGKTAFWPKKRRDISGIVSRFHLISILSAMLFMPADAYDTPRNLVSTLTAQSTFHTDDPIIHIITRRGLHSRSVRHGTPVFRLPRWGSAKWLWSKYCA